MVTAGQATQVAAEVFAASRAAVQWAKRSGRLDAFAYSRNSFERWLVCETYAAICLDDAWARLVELLGPHADARMEVIAPRQPTARKHIDLSVGLTETFPANVKYRQPTATSPVFEFKLLRSDDLVDGLAGLRGDVTKLREAGCRNAYELVLYRAGSTEVIDSMRSRVRAELLNLWSLDELAEFAPLGPETCDLERHGGMEPSVSFCLEAFRVRTAERRGE